MFKRLFYGACLTIVLCGASLLGMLTYFQVKATPSAAPSMSTTSIAATYDDQGFPLVDWNYWQKINPDMVGWVTVPDTDINYPIVQTSANNSSFYLTHDIYKEWNYLGCPYIDASFQPLGLNSQFLLIYGHNPKDGAMFADFAKYNNQQFAKEHQKVLLQTPKSKQVLKVAKIDIVKATDTDKPEFRSFTEVSSPASVVAFCTCSYNFWPDDERTIIYTVRE